KAPFGNPAFGGFVIVFSVQFRAPVPVFSHPPCFNVSLYFAKFAFSEILSLAKILLRTPSPTAKSSIA
uniref:hypothetical protein n=1 Tax=Gemmiger formicilis TaxID=745368 RepID=UPI003FF0F54E